MGVIWHLIRKEFLQVLRDRAMLGVIFVMPIVQLFVLGYAVTTDVRNIPVGIVDADHSQESRAVIERLCNFPRFKIHSISDTSERIQTLIDNGEISLGIIFPREFSRRINRGQSPQIQMIMDSVDSNTSLIASGYSRGILTKYFREMDRSNSQMDIELVRIQAFYNPELESRFTIVPGIVALLLTVITMLLTALSLVKERELGTLEQLSVTPINPIQLIIGKILPFAVLGGVALTVALTVAFLHFKIPLEGNLGTLILFTALYLLTTLGLGMFISTVTSTQQQALFMAWFILVMSVLMSGFMFPISNMPVILQKVTYLIPLRYYITVLREILLKGTSILDLGF